MRHPLCFVLSSPVFILRAGTRGAPVTKRTGWELQSTHPGAPVAPGITQGFQQTQTEKRSGGDIKRRRGVGWKYVSTVNQPQEGRLPLRPCVKQPESVKNQKRWRERAPEAGCRLQVGFLSWLTYAGQSLNSGCCSRAGFSSNNFVEEMRRDRQRDVWDWPQLR